MISLTRYQGFDECAPVAINSDLEYGVDLYVVEEADGGRTVAFLSGQAAPEPYYLPESWAGRYWVATDFQLLSFDSDLLDVVRRELNTPASGIWAYEELGLLAVMQEANLLLLDASGRAVGDVALDFVEDYSWGDDSIRVEQESEGQLTVDLRSFRTGATTKAPDAPPDIEA